MARYLLYGPLSPQKLMNLIFLWKKLGVKLITLYNILDSNALHLKIKKIDRPELPTQKEGASNTKH